MVNQGFILAFTRGFHETAIELQPDWNMQKVSRGKILCRTVNLL